MRKIVLIAPGQLELQENCVGIDMQQEMVKIDVSACGICGSDLASLTGRRPLTNERYFGHEFSGTVVEAGEGHNGMKTGMRVASELAKTCGHCWNCRKGLENYCRSMNDALLPGGFSSETLVLNTPSYSFLSTIPSTLDDITATLLEPTNCAFRIAMKANIKPGDTVLVFGLGAIGFITSQILKSFGAGVVLGTDRSKLRLEQLKKSGLIDIIDRNDENWLEQVKEAGGVNGVDVVIEATGAPTVLVDAIQAVRPGGRIVAGSVYHGAIDNFEPLPIMRKELTIVGAKGPYPHLKTDGTSAVVDVLVKLQNDLKKIITVYEYKDAIKAFNDMSSGAAIKPVITFK
jgi:L-iditol 2-dehydrogenase